MLRLTPLINSLLVILLLPAMLYAGQNIILFQDGGLITLETTSKNGVAELTLPMAVKPTTIRVKPVNQQDRINQVGLLPARPNAKLGKEITSYREQKQKLEDRLKMLDAREATFLAAAKSQSSKVVRKTKAEPNPLAAIRQGTDFAFSQLEATYTAKRRAELELQKISSQLDTVLQKEDAGNQIIRITTTPLNAKVAVTAQLADKGWQPAYEIRADQDNSMAALTIIAESSLKAPAGYTVWISPVRLADNPPETGSLKQYLKNSPTRLETYHLPIEQVQVNTGPVQNFRLSIRNSTTSTLSSGRASLYYNGEYLGSASISKTDSGELFIINGPEN